MARATESRARSGATALLRTVAMRSKARLAAIAVRRACSGGTQLGGQLVECSHARSRAPRGTGWSLGAGAAGSASSKRPGISASRF